METSVERQSWRELTATDLEKLKETPVGDYFSIDPNGGGVFLHDVMTLQPFEPGRVPSAVEQTPELKMGLEYLQKLGQDGKLVVQLVLGSHGAAVDFEQMVYDHGDALTAPLIGLEMTGNSDGSLVVADAPGRSEFQAEQLRWAEQQGKTILPCEPQGDSDAELNARMNRLWNEFVTPARSNKLMDPAYANAMAVIAERAYQAVRQWAILARLGTHLQDNQDALPINGPLRVPLVLGAWHEPSADRLKMIGVPCEVFHSENPEWDQAFKDYGELAMATTLFGYAPMRFLQMPEPY